MVRNDKGFTLVELLAVVVIMGILMGVGIPAVSKHLQNSREESYDVMINSIYDGAMSYMMDRNEYPTGTSILEIKIIDDLENAGYVESLSDPGSSNKCDGKVEVKVVPSSSCDPVTDPDCDPTAKPLPKYEYKIRLECPSKTIDRTITS